jgi:hypothetical protein
VPKTCFVICPIGDEGTEVRQFADDLFDLVLEPALEPFGFELLRADRIPGSGVITSEIIELVQGAQLCIIDISASNPNVFYEAGRRHETGLPFVQMIRRGEPIPFDLAGIRTLPYDLATPRAARDAIDELRRYVTEFEKVGYSGGQTGISISTLAQVVDRIERKLDRLGGGSKLPEVPSASGNEPSFGSMFDDPRKQLTEAIFAGRTDIADAALARLESLVSRGPDLLAPAALLASTGSERGARLVELILEDEIESLDDDDFRSGVGAVVQFYTRTDREPEGVDGVRKLIEARIARRAPAAIAHAGILNQLQRILFGAHEYEEAAKVISEVVELDPTNPSFWYNQSLILEELKDIPGACAAIDKCLATSEHREKDDDDHLSQAIDVYARAGRAEDARAAFERLQAISATRAGMALLNPTNRAVIQGA